MRADKGGTPLHYAALFRGMAENLDCGVVVIDAGHTILYCNRWIGVRAGMAKDVTLGRSLIDVFTELDASVLNSIDEAVETGQPRVLSPLLHPLWVTSTPAARQFVRVVPFNADRGGQGGAVIIVQDVTAQFEYERHLQDRTRREWEQVFQAISHPALILDPHRRIVAANDAAAGIVGLPPEELAGRQCYTLFHGTAGPPPDCPFERLQVSRAAEAAVVEMDILGGTFLTSCTPVWAEGGRLEKVIHIATDVTELKRAEKEQAMLTRRLEGLWRLAQLVDADEETFSEHVLAECLDITGSRYGFFGFIDGDEKAMYSYGHSRDAKADCRVAARPAVFPIVGAGVWAEAVRRRAPVVINDCSLDHPGKKGLPEGHVPISRLMVVPVLAQERVVLIAAVANKATDYSEDDLRQLNSFIFSVRVVFEKKRNDEALKKAEAKYRTMFENALEGMFQTTLDGKIRTANPALARMLGYETPQDLIDGITDLGRQLYVNPNQRREVTSLLASRGLLEGYPVEVYRKDGTVAWVSLNVYAVRGENGAFAYIEGAAEDITGRKEAERALSASEERYRAFVEHSSEAICLFEMDGGPVDVRLPADEQVDLIYARALIGECNTTFATAHGFGGPEEMRGLRIGQVFPRLAKENLDYLRAFVESGHRLAGMETKELTRDGGIAYFLNSLNGHREGDRLFRIWSVKQDISRIKRVEEEIRTLNAELEQRIQERTARLEVANRELEAFAYSVSHDLRAPLRAIDGFSAALLEDYGHLLDDEGQRLFGVIRSSAKRMDDLITGLLALSRVARVESRFSVVDMTALAAAVFREAASEDVRRTISFSAAALPEAQGDPTLLRQVWTNLLSNAVKFTAPKDERAIEVGGYTDGPVHTYFVKDNGIGFNPDYAGKLFGVFQRLHKAGEFEGTGVGLAIVQRIVARHGGRVWAEGRVGDGATFWFALPVRRVDLGDGVLKDPP